MLLKVKIVSRTKPVSGPFSVSRIPTIGEFVETEEYPNFWHEISAVVYTPNREEYDALLYSKATIDQVSFENILFPR